MVRWSCDCEGDFKCPFCKGKSKTKPEHLFGACMEAEKDKEIERLRAKRDRAIREKNGLFDALRDKKPTTVNVQVASTGQQETINKQRQRIASLDKVLDDVWDQCNDAWTDTAVRINKIARIIREHSKPEALAKEQDDG